jgi:hypothetical protein
VISARNSKCRDLNVAAILLAKFPTKIALTKPHSVSRDLGGRGVSVHHMIRCLQRGAKRCAESIFLPFAGFESCMFGPQLVTLIPRDRYLWILLKTLEIFPPDYLQPDVVIEFEKFSTTLGNHTPYSYPDIIEPDLRTILDGLRYVHTINNQLRVPGLQWTENGNMERSKLQFVISNTYRTARTMCSRDGCQPCISGYEVHKGKEHEWLRAFLEVVTWMEENLKIPQRDIEAIDSDEFAIVGDDASLKQATLTKFL